MVAGFLPAISLQARSVEQSDSNPGKQLFEHHCAVCHGMDGSGGRGPSLRRAHLAHASTDAALRSVISDGIPPDMPDAWFFSEDDLTNVARYVRSLGAMPVETLAGDPNRGAEVYANHGCSNCHILAGNGHAYGPELTAIGERRSPAFIRQKLLDPKSELQKGSGGWTIDSAPVFGFLLVEATTRGGETIRGLRLNEDSFTIQIIDSEDRFRSLRKQDLKDLKKLRGVTGMPSYQNVLTDAELEDLVTYLAGQQQQ